MYRINNNNTSCLMYSAKETWENLLLCDAKKMIEQQIEKFEKVDE